MDPDENLNAQRRLAARLDQEEHPNVQDVLRLCELVIALDDWIKAGGFLPAAWRR